MHLVRYSAHLFSRGEALHKVFFPFSTLLSPFYRHQHRHCPHILLPHKVRHYRWKPGPVERSQHSRRLDEGIDENLVQLVSPESGALLQPETPRAILARMDRKAYFLVEVSPATETSIAVCKILPRKQVFDYEKLKSKKPKTSEKPSKQLEFSWTIDSKDLRHKLDRMDTFLNEGRRVELIIAKRKVRGARERVVTAEDRNKLLASIRAFAQALDGVREWKAMVELGGENATAENDEGGTETVQRRPKAMTAILFFESKKTAGLRTKEPAVAYGPTAGKSDAQSPQPKDQLEVTASPAPSRFGLRKLFSRDA